MSDDFVSVRFCVPRPGVKIVLTHPWEFDLFYEQRNDTLLKAMGLYQTTTGSAWRGHVGNTFNSSRITVPSGTKLTVDRIYIRKPYPDFDSLTFKVGKKDSPDHRFHKTRFWAKLRDVNKIRCLPIGDDSQLDLFESYLDEEKRFINSRDRYDFLI